MSLEAIFYFGAKGFLGGTLILLLVNVVWFVLALRKKSLTNRRLTGNSSLTIVQGAILTIVFGLSGVAFNEYREAQVERKDVLRKIIGISEKLDSKIVETVAHHRVSFQATQKIANDAIATCDLALESGEKIGASIPCQVALSLHESQLPNQFSHK